MNLFIKQKELNAQENDKYLAIQEFKCNVSPSNLDAEDIAIHQNDQTQQQIIQDKLEIVFDISSHDSKNNNEASNQISENSFINTKKQKSQRVSKGPNNAGVESLIYSQSSCNVVKDRRFDSQRFSEPKFRESIQKRVDQNILKHSEDILAKQSNNETLTINRQLSQDVNRLIQLDQSPKFTTYRRQNTLRKAWQVLILLIKIVKNFKLQEQLERISPFVGDKSHQQQDQQNGQKLDKKKSFVQKVKEQKIQLIQNNRQIINQYQKQQKQLIPQIQQTFPQFCLASFIYDFVSIVIAFLSLVYYSALLIIQPSLSSKNIFFRQIFSGFFIAFYITDIIKELMPISLSHHQNRFAQILISLKAYTKFQFFFDIISFFSIITVEVIYPDIITNYYIAIIFVLGFLLFKFFTIVNKWLKIQSYFLYSQRLSSSLMIVKLLSQFLILLHSFTIAYFIVGFYFKDSQNNSWLNQSRQDDEQNLLIIYAYSFQSCYLQLFHQIIYLPQTQYEIYFFFMLQFIFCIYFIYLIDQIFYNRKFSNEYYQEFTTISKYIGEKNMGLQQKIELFNLIKVKKEKDQYEKSIQIYKQYSQNISKHLQKYFRMVYFEQLVKQDILYPLFSKHILKKSCKIVEEVFKNDKEVIYDEYNDEEISLFIIIEGEVSIYLQHENPSELLLESQNFPKLKKFSLIGYSSFFSGMRKRYIYKAHEKVRLLRIPRDAFIKILQKSSEADYQKFCELKDRILFEDNTDWQQKTSSIHFRENLSQLCLVCQSSTHDISECNKCHFIMDKLFLFSQEKEKQVARVIFQRKVYKNTNQLKLFNKMQIVQQKFLSSNKSLLNFYYSSYLQNKNLNNQTYLTSFKNITTNNNISANINQAANSQSSFVMSDNQIQLNQSKFANGMITSDTNKNASNRLLQQNNASPSISVVAKDRSFSIQSLKNVQMPESNKSPVPESQFKSNSSNQHLRQQAQPIQTVIQEESMRSIQSQKRSTIAQLYPEKIQSDLNHGIHVNNNQNISSSHYKTKIMKKFDDINDEIFRGESPISSLYNVSRISNTLTPTSKQNIFGQEQKQNFIPSKNDIIVLQVEENIAPNVYEFNLNAAQQGHPNKSHEYNLIKSQDPYNDGNIGPQPTAQNPSQKQIYVSNLQNIQEKNESIMDDSLGNSNNYLESSIFHQQRQIISLDLDQMFITKNYFKDYNLDIILNYIRDSKPLKEINGTLTTTNQFASIKNKKYSLQLNKKSVYKS
ncbi:cyclic nucleotide-binding domain protein (macronuclear) [Tetrahymena thermophila SB210]|uniref:Cyclic nucleotide-binding domain protein n=1 Tax=Tetrahymena thermophila (strain SB210) TaxID=312017 RepID=Q237E3_TETTS|nr:cyclic nucleotide-binding domain protein [Tetrahymena thermophila SB210]EAR92798.2 cyclic nucleotide-binding domain protein [Tetrahymena thermophila SB210]|eukprot:XP_001013043.2 cyclic nucleotide-binding domain protein [Tetrahymena thermophila SB210]